jgi:hypothetical protein
MLATILCQSVGPASDLKSVGNSLVPVCCLACDLRSFITSLVKHILDQRLTNRLAQESMQYISDQKLPNRLAQESTQHILDQRLTNRLAQESYQHILD